MTPAIRSSVRMILLHATMVFTIATDAEVINIDSDQLLQLMDQNAIVIDVRRADEWQNTGIIENTHTVTFFDKYGGFDADKWLREISAFTAPNTPIVLICHAGVRSRWIADWMDQHTGFDKIYNHPPGISGWMYQDRPLVRFQQE